MRDRLWCALFLFVCVFSSVSAHSSDTPKTLSILRVTPTGEDVPPGNQIVIEFNRPVVPLGRMERTAEEVGVDITPPLKCQWRWLNTSSLSCNLDSADTMAPATKYVVKIAPVITAEDGGTLAKEEMSGFITQRPDVSYTNFNTWRSPTHPVIRVVFTQPVSRSSVEQHLFIAPSGGGTRVPLLVKPDEDWQKLPDYVLSPTDKLWVRVDQQARQSDDQKTEINGEEARRVWLVEPQSELAVNSAATLRIEPGLLSAEGTEPSAQSRDIVSFQTFPDFGFAGVSCTANDGSSILIPPQMTPDQRLLCNPLRGVSLAFTVPVLRSEVKDNAVFNPSLSGDKKDYNPWGDENRDWSSLGTPHSADRLYYVGLPVGLKAAQEYALSLPASGFEDEFGRVLPQAIEMKFSTNHRNPNFEMPHKYAVLESQTDSELPFYVNNLESFTFKYRSVTTDGAKDNQTYSKQVTKIEDIQYGVPGGVREMLDGKSGALYGFLSTYPDVPDKWEGDRKLFAQVTPWQAHLKLGHFNSLLWVTDLATGLPVEGVKVSLYTDSLPNISAPKDILAHAVTDSQGIAILPGSETLDPLQNLLNAWDDAEMRLFARLDKGSDMALLPLAPSFALDTWNLSEDGTNAYTRDRFGHLKSWGMTAQGIYRAGDTMQYKIFLRNQNEKTLTAPPKGRYTLEIVDPTGKTVQEVKDVVFSDFGAYAGEYPIPQAGAVGWYRFKLKADFRTNPPDEVAENAEGAEQEYEYEEKDEQFTLYPLQVLVSDFTPAPFRVTTEIGGDLFRPGDAMTIESLAALHSGGPYGDALARVTVTLNMAGFSSENPVAQNFYFGGSSEGLSSEQLLQKEQTLDDKGAWAEVFVLPQQPIYYGTLAVESAVQDDRGKSVASLAQADYVGVDRFVGVKSPQWFYTAKQNVSLQTLVVDDQGNPAPGTMIESVIEYEEISVAKVKGAGNAYLSDITREWKQVAACSQVSALEGQDCTFTPEKAGTYRMIAKISDTKGREHKTEIMIWVAGDDYVQWNDEDKYILPVIPEKKDYKVGDTAKFLVKNPYPGAKALVTVERYGIVEHFVQTLEGGAPVLEIPIKPDYLPGFYLSVMVVSPRVDKDVPPLGQVDLGKPTFRLGYVTIPVRDPYKEMTVEVKAAQDVYRPRDKVQVSLKAAPRHALEKAEPIEMAVAVLDESVFDLISVGRDAFDPYKGFYDLDALDLRNYSLIYRLVGRQKFEKKGANPGGDGGGDLDMRNLFKFVSYWNPALKTNANGQASITFDAPDNLTGWRVLAVATTPTDRMGLGEGTFKVNRPTELRPVMPNQVREGDTFTAGFSVMNRTDAPRTLTVKIEAFGDAVTKNSDVVSAEQTVTLEPFKRQTVYVPIEAKMLPVDREIADGSITFRAFAEDAADKDSMEFTLPVYKKRVFDVAATYGTTTEAKVSENILFPQEIYTDSGDVSVVLSPSVIANLAGAFRYMRDYPYICWEQVLTRGVMAAHYKELKKWLPDSLVWEEADKLPQSTLDTAANYQAPNGGMTYFVATDDRADPYLSAYTAMAFSWLKKDGYTIPADVEKKLHDYLLNFLRQDAVPDFYQPGMTSTVRAVALAALAREGKIAADDVQRYAPHLKNMSLFGKAHFLQAALMFENTKASAKEAANMIFAAGNETGGKFMFSETLDDGYLRLLATPLRDNCAILSAFLSYGKTEDGKELIGDKPFKLVRMITQSRESRDHWENTQENMFCMNGLIEYARVYETEKPAMTVTAALDTTKFGEAGFTDFRDTPVTLSKPITAEDPGQKRALNLTKDGPGRLYYAARVRYAPKSGWENKMNAGMDIGREYSVKKDGKWTILKDGEAIKRGDLVRVDLFLNLPAPRNFVVVNDPLPGGLETVNRDLATASTVDDAEAVYDQAGGSLWFKYSDWREYNFSFWSFYHKELRHDSARFFSDWLPAGNYHLSYVAQAIADGNFAAPPVRAEEMYDPDVYGRGQNGALVIQNE